MGILATRADERVRDVSFSEDSFTVELMDGRAITTPLAWFPRLLSCSLRRGHSLAFLLLLGVFCNGCKDYPTLVKEGTLFSATEMASPDKALVYIYWPREEQGRRNHLWVGTCEGSTQEILPGGYTALVVDPGPSCFQAETLSEFLHSRASVSRSIGRVELSAQPGRTFFIRLEQERLLLISRTVLRLAKPDVAGPEIGRCRRSVQLTLDETVRQYLGEKRR